MIDFVTESQTQNKVDENTINFVVSANLMIEASHEFSLQLMDLEDWTQTVCN